MAIKEEYSFVQALGAGALEAFRARGLVGRGRRARGRKSGKTSLQIEIDFRFHLGYTQNE